MIPFADAAPLLALTGIITGFMCWFVDMVDRKSNKHLTVK